MDQTILIFLAAIGGVGTRTIVRYLDKIINGEISGFDLKFVASAVLAAIITIVTAMGFVLAFQIPPNMANEMLLGMTVFWESYGINDLVNIPVNNNRFTVKAP